MATFLGGILLSKLNLTCKNILSTDQGFDKGVTVTVTMGG